MKRTMNVLGLLLLLLAGNAVSVVVATEYHVALSGNDTDEGLFAKPFKSISAAARVAQPGDVVTVHAGTYRERVTPPRGGESDSRRIIYRAAPGEQVEIKGSEVVTNWVQVQDDVWKVSLPNTFFGDFNPYRDLIHGDWFDPRGRQHHTGAVYLNGDWLIEAATLEAVLTSTANPPRWFAEVDAANTTIWAQFKDVNPNEQVVEINVRQTVFYPDQPGVNYLTVRGFTLRDAATPWAPPTAEQMGLIGTHWSKGWIIESNNISHSICSGVTLGKYGDEWDNTSADTAEGYVKTIDRALKNGWNKETVGHHIVRNNTIAHCEQTGICGSLGAIFSQITGNHIHDIWTRRQFAGAEMGGIKLHAAIDVLIDHNRIHNAGRALWMDWMAQGTWISGNLCYGNSTDDLFVEVDHGPFLVDNNLFLSPLSLRDWSEGGAYVHNLFAGRIDTHPELSRATPFHQPHSTALAGLSNIRGGDDRFYNNVFLAPAGTASAGFGLAAYDNAEAPLQTGGNVYFGGARPHAREANPLTLTAIDPRLELVETGDRVVLHVDLGPALKEAATVRVTTELLGRAKIPNLPFENPDGSALVVDQDYFGRQRSAAKPTPGPFENAGAGRLRLEVW
ncbi:MAG TPA: right-handed parallel beta-helix repeat-containing protein [Verrucomicrobiae bacterium]|nr:right-handed parallel beta-helix repeat-containing protein [Verrucomicrobiae bacterium]